MVAGGTGRLTDADLRKRRAAIETMTLAGLTETAIAAELNVSTKAVKRHRKAIREGWLRESDTALSAMRAQLIAEARQVAKDSYNGAIRARAVGDMTSEASFLNLRLR